MSKANVFASEEDVKQAVKKILNDAGAFYFMPPANAFGRSGISDFIGVLDGKFFAIETKFGSNKPTPMQLRFGDKVLEHGGRFLVINENNLGDVGRMLEEL